MQLYSMLWTQTPASALFFHDRVPHTFPSFLFFNSIIRSDVKNLLYHLPLFFFPRSLVIFLHVHLCFLFFFFFVLLFLSTKAKPGCMPVPFLQHCLRNEPVSLRRQMFCSARNGFYGELLCSSSKSIARGFEFFSN